MDKCVPIVLVVLLTLPAPTLAGGGIKSITTKLGTVQEAPAAENAAAGRAPLTHMQTDAQWREALSPSNMATIALSGPTALALAPVYSAASLTSKTINENIAGHSQEMIDAAPWLDTNILALVQMKNKKALRLLKDISLFKVSGQTIVESFPTDRKKLLDSVAGNNASLPPAKLRHKQKRTLGEIDRRVYRTIKRLIKNKKIVVQSPVQIPLERIDDYVELRRDIYHLISGLPKYDPDSDEPEPKHDSDADVLAGIIMHSPYREAVIYTADQKFARRIGALRQSPYFPSSLDRLSKRYQELFPPTDDEERKGQSLYIPKLIFKDIEENAPSENPRELPSGPGWHALRTTNDPVTGAGHIYTVIQEQTDAPLPLNLQSMPKNYPALARKLGIENAVDNKKPALRFPDTVSLKMRLLQLPQRSRPVITQFKRVKSPNIVKWMERWSRGTLTISDKDDSPGDLAGYLMLPEDIVMFSRELAQLWLQFYRIAVRHDQPLLSKTAVSSLRALKQRLDETTIRLAAAPDPISRSEIAKALKLLIYQENDLLLNPALNTASLPGKKKEKQYLRRLRKNCLSLRGRVSNQLELTVDAVVKNIERWRGAQSPSPRRHR